MIGWLIWLGMSEGTAIAVASSKWLRRAAAVVLAAVALLSGMWYLTHLGGTWREEAIRKAWAAKFTAVRIQQQRDAIERIAYTKSIDLMVREAIERYEAENPKQVEAPAHGSQPAVVFAPVVSGKCEVDLPSVKRLNKIIR